MIDFSRLHTAVETFDPAARIGRVTRVVGLVIEARGPSARIGELCYIIPDAPTSAGPADAAGIALVGGHLPAAPPRGSIPAEVVGFRDGSLLLMPFTGTMRISSGSQVIATGKTLTIPVGEALLGRVLDGLGNPVDGLGPLPMSQCYAVSNQPPAALRRKRITQPLPLGVRAIDALLTCGAGQRMGIFAGSGVGKSTLIGMIARNTSADVNVIGLIGERGREVREFIEKDLGQEGLARSVVVAATSDSPALERIKGAQVATAVAEYFRDQGLHVMLMMDSLTRFAWAQREVGLAIGEPPTRNGYTPSVFALLPQLLERAGMAENGSITGLYTVLVEADDMNDPIADAVRAVLDGHIILSRDLAARNHYPAIDILASVSRLMPDITTRAHQDAAAEIRALLAAYRSSEDLISIGAYVHGTNRRTDRAIALYDTVMDFLRQPMAESADFSETIERAIAIPAAYVEPESPPAQNQPNSAAVGATA